MKFRIRFAHQVVGVFILVAVAFVVAILVLMGVNQRWFAKNYYYESEFDSAGGLSVGMAVNFRGFEIGRVTNISLSEENRVEVDFYIQDTYVDRVYRNSVLQLTSSPIGLGGGLVFHQGVEPTEPLPEGSFVPSLSTPEGRELVAQGKVEVPRSSDAIGSLIDQLDPILTNVNNVLMEVEVTLATVNSALAGEDEGPMGVMMANLNDLMVEVDRTLEETTVRTNVVLDNVGVITGNFSEASEEFADPTGIIPKLLDPKGSIATILDDNNALYDQIEAILISMNSTASEVEELSGFINSQTPQIAALLAEGREAVSTGQDVLEGLSNNPLLRGGITPQLDQPTTFQSFREAEF
jgi:phospholipid/cholesterol/gamma-HCH transport system substrate-binding protein